VRTMTPEATKRQQPLSESAKLVRARPRPTPSDVPIPKVTEHDCLVWEVVLKKEEESNDRYGFSYANRRDLNAGPDETALDQTVDSTAFPGIEVLIVKGLLAEGLMFDWNIEHPDAEVLIGDRVIDVNGKTTVYEMKQALKENLIALKIRRYPSVFTIELTKTETNSKLGFKFERPSLTNPNVETTAILRITEVIAGGLLDENNKANFAAGLPHFVVTAGMYIEAANDVDSNADSMADELRLCTNVRIRIRRRPV